MTGRDRSIACMYALRKPTEGDPNWYAELMSIDGIFTSGKTKEEAIENIEMVIQNHVDDNPNDQVTIHQFDPAKVIWSGEYSGYEFKMYSAKVAAVI